LAAEHSALLTFFISLGSKGLKKIGALMHSYRRRILAVAWCTLDSATRGQKLVYGMRQSMGAHTVLNVWKTIRLRRKSGVWLRWLTFAQGSPPRSRGPSTPHASPPPTPLYISPLLRLKPVLEVISATVVEDPAGRFQLPLPDVTAASVAILCRTLKTQYPVLDESSEVTAAALAGVPTARPTALPTVDEGKGM
jgi:hypothetical protein